MASNPNDRLVRLFERDLRVDDVDEIEDVAAAEPARTPRVSQELEAQVAEFASETRTSGGTPEQMLVRLKNLLLRAAPDVPGSRRSALVSKLTGRAIDAFFRRS